MKIKNFRNLGSLSTVALLLVGPVTTAAIDEAPPYPNEVHCVVEVRPIGESEPPESICFNTEAGAKSYLGVLSTNSAARGTAEITVLGTAYKDSNGGGSSFTFWGANGCVGVVFGFSSLAAGWDNSISSAGGSNGCWLTLYSGTSYGGSSLNCTPWCATVYGLNDNVKSLVFRPTGTFG